MRISNRSNQSYINTTDGSIRKTFSAIDRWYMRGSGGSGDAFNVSQGLNSIVFNNIVYPACRQTVTSAANPTTLSGFFFYSGISQLIESSNVYDMFNGSSKTSLSFIFLTNVTGTYPAVLTTISSNGNEANTYSFTFSATANTPIKVSYLIPSVTLTNNSPTTSSGLRLSIGSIASTNYQTPSANGSIWSGITGEAPPNVTNW
jgi:hypothetical protein